MFKSLTCKSYQIALKISLSVKEIKDCNRMFIVQ